MADISRALDGSQTAIDALCRATGRPFGQLSPIQIGFTSRNVLRGPTEGLEIASACSHKVRQTCSDVLVGVLDSDDRGVVLLRPPRHVCRTRHACRECDCVVIAPPPPANLRGCLVWLKSWTWIPSLSKADRADECARGLLEVSRSDVIVLAASRERQADCPGFLPLHGVPLTPTESVNIYGIVAAKSPVLSRRSKSPAFVLEVGNVAWSTSAALGGAYIVFSKEKAIAWWPFVHVGNIVFCTKLKVKSLRRFAGQKVFLAEGTQVHVLDVPPCAEKSLPPIPRQCGCPTPRSIDAFSAKQRADPAALLSQPASRVCDARWTNMSNAWLHQFCFGATPGIRFVSFTGIIESIADRGWLQLRGGAKVNLVSYGGWIGGAEATAMCFRPGAAIACDEFALSGHPRTGAVLLPTARSSVSLISLGGAFGQAFDNRSPAWLHSGRWPVLWSQLHWSDIAWLEHLYCALTSKLSSWLENVASQGHERTSAGGMTSALVGQRDDDGLLMHVLELHGRRLANRSPSRDVYASFMSSNAATASVMPLSLDQPTMPTLSQLVHTVTRFWGRASSVPQSSRFADIIAKSIKTVSVGPRSLTEECLGSSACGPCSAQARTEPDMCFGLSLPGNCVLPCGSSQTSHSDVSRSASLSNSCIDGYRVAFVGVFGDPEHPRYTQTLTDSTGSIEAVVFGQWNPALRGALVLVSRYKVLIHAPPGQSPRVVLIIDPNGVETLVPGPYEPDLAAVLPTSGHATPLEPANGNREASPPGAQSRTNPSPSPAHSDQLASALRFTYTESNVWNSLELNTDTRSLLAILVARRSVMSWQGSREFPTPRFSVECFVLGAAEHRTSSEWAELARSDAEVRCSRILFEGDDRTALHSSLGAGVASAISTTSRPHDVRAWQERVHLKVGDCGHSLGHGVRLCEVFDATCLLGEPENGGRLWQESLTSAHPRGHEPTRHAVWQTGRMAKVIARLEHRILSGKMYPRTSILELRRQAPYVAPSCRTIQSLEAIVLSAPTAFGHELEQDASGGSFLVRDAALAFVIAKVFVPPQVVLPPLLVEGSCVLITGFQYTDTGDDAHTRITLTEDSSVEVQDVERNLNLCHMPCQRRPLYPTRVAASIHRGFISGYVRPIPASSHDSLQDRFQYVYLRISRVYTVRLRRTSLKRDDMRCRLCGSANGALEFEALFEADDGTSRATIQTLDAHAGFELVSATEDQAAFLSECCSDFGELRAREKGFAAFIDQEQANLDVTALNHTPEAAELLLTTLAARCPRYVIAVLRRPRMDRAETEEVEYPRAPWRVKTPHGGSSAASGFTIVHKSVDEVVAECMAVFDDPFWGSPPRGLAAAWHVEPP